MLTSADEAEQRVSDQTWRQLLWISPLHDNPSERAMLHLDDELAGLLEAADMPADQARTHTTKPEPAPSVPGKDATTQWKSAGALSVICYGLYSPRAVL